MGRLFSGTNQYLQSASAIDLSGASGQISVMLWYWWDAFALDDDLLLEFGTGGVSDGGFTFDWNDSVAGAAGRVGLYTYNAGQTQLNQQQIARPAAAAWHQLVVSMDRVAASATVCAINAVWIDGASVSVSGTTSAALSPTPFGNLTLTVFARSDGSLAGAGRAAELAIWKAINLSGADVTALWNGGAGVDARTVQPGTLAYYNQICGSASPEPRLVGSTNLTVVGATSVAHPISGAGICVASAAAGGSGRAAARQRRQQLLGIRGWHG